MTSKIIICLQTAKSMIDSLQIKADNDFMQHQIEDNHLSVNLVL